MSTPAKKPYEPFAVYKDATPETDPNIIELRALQMAAFEADRKCREKFNEMFELVGEKSDIKDWFTKYRDAKYRSLLCKVGDYWQGQATIYKRIK